MSYYILPIQFLAVTPFLNDQTTLVRNAITIIFPLTLLFFKPNAIYKFKMMSTIFSLILFVYFLSALYNHQNWNQFLLGNYGRSDGVLVLLGLYLIFLLSAYSIPDSKMTILKIFNLIINLTIALGILELMQLNPIRWTAEYKGIKLSLANPNFASTFIACIAIFCVYGYLEEKGFSKNVYVAKYLFLSFLVIKTESSQGFILLILGIILSLCFEIMRGKNLKSIVVLYKKRISVYIVVLISAPLIILITNKNLVNYLNTSLNLNDRLAHWSLATKVWNENRVLGVGISGLQSHIAEFKTYSDVRRWGEYGHPDKSHNIFLDHLANGGLIALLLYLLLFSIITFFGIKNVLRTSNLKTARLNASVFIFWLSYILQNLFSPSQIVIETAGMLIGGYICGTYYHTKSFSVGRNDTKPK
jgi:O-antigen ligase